MTGRGVALLIVAVLIAATVYYFSGPYLAALLAVISVVGPVCVHYIAKSLRKKYNEKLLQDASLAAKDRVAKRNMKFGFGMITIAFVVMLLPGVPAIGQHEILSISAAILAVILYLIGFSLVAYRFATRWYSFLQH